MIIYSTPDSPALARAILNTLVYADIFDYPLTAAQIQRYLVGIQAPADQISEQLDSLKDSGMISEVGELYTLSGRESIVAMREQRELHARRLWPQAARYGRIIAGLPFVRMLAVTGSLAMDNIDEEGDIDYLVVTMPGQLWLCRLLVLIVVRLASWRGIRLCPNYLLSERALEIHDRNLYAAHEFVQMIPLFGLDVYQRMLGLNAWVKDFLPNVEGLPPDKKLVIGLTPADSLRPLLEHLLMTPPGIWLGNWEMDRKIRRLSRENAGNPEAVFSPDLCKGHSQRHSQRTSAHLAERLSRLAFEPHR